MANDTQTPMQRLREVELELDAIDDAHETMPLQPRILMAIARLLAILVDVMPG